MNPHIVLWIYIVLLIAGGLTGYLKAKSKASIIASSIFAAVLALFALDILPVRFAWTIIVVLILFFGRRYFESKKFMPGGLMFFVSLLTLSLLLFFPAR